MPYLVNIRSLVTGGSIWYSWFIMVYPVVSAGSEILVLKGFIVAPVISICGFPLYKCLLFTSLVNATWLNMVDGVLADPILPVLGCMVVYF